MVPACEDLCVSGTLLFNDGVGSVPADVVESVDVALSVFCDDEVVASDGVTQPVAGVLDTQAVGHEEPSFREDGTALELVHGWGCCISVSMVANFGSTIEIELTVPCCWQSPHRSFLGRDRILCRVLCRLSKFEVVKQSGSHCVVDMFSWEMVDGL